MNDLQQTPKRVRRHAPSTPPVDLYGNAQTQYLKLLVELNGIVPIEGNYPCFIVRDYIHGEGGSFRGLSSTEYVHVYVVPLTFRDGDERMVVMCDCHDMQTARDALRGISCLDHGSRDFKLQSCLHAKVIQDALASGRLKTKGRYISALDQASFGKPSNRCTMLEGCPGSLLVSFGVDERAFGRICITTDSNKHYQCCNDLCIRRKKATSCAHVTRFVEWLDAQDETSAFDGYEPLPENFVIPPLVSEKNKECVSKEKVPLHYASCHTKARATFHGDWLLRCDECEATQAASCRHCIPDKQGTCECGGKWSSEVKLRCRGTLTGLYASTPVDVYYRWCLDCGARKQYDGKESGVYNFSNYYLFHHEVMFGYVDSMLHCKLPYAAFYQILQENYKRAATGTALCGGATFRRATQAFMFDLVDCDYSKGFECPTCAGIAAHKRVVIMDGKMMGHRADLRLDDVIAEPEGDAIVINHTEFIYIKHTKLRKYVRMFGNTSKPYMDDNEYARMLRLAKEHLPALHKYLEMIGYQKVRAHTGGFDAFVGPAEHARLLRSISTEYAMSAVLPPRLIFGTPSSPLERIMEASMISAKDRQFLRETWPALAEVITKSPNPEDTKCLPRTMHPLLRDLQTVARLPASSDDTSHLDLHEGLDNNEKFVFMPNNPVCRKLARYGDMRDDTTYLCNKYNKKCRGMTPGIFAMFCPHGVCLGFRIMSRHEGPRTAFEMIYERFKVAPGVIIYDNACNFHRYCMKRQGAYFANTMFLIDRMHSSGHVGCPESFNMRVYPGTMEIMPGTTIEKLNSQAAEQANSRLENICTQVAFMKQDNFMKYVKFYLFCKNEILIERQNKLLL